MHPSLFPLVYGRSKILAKGRIGLADCLEYIGKGTTIKLTDSPEIHPASYRAYYGGKPKVWSKEYQWLPCQVEFVGGEAVGITSYINNLHPVKFSSLYNVIEACIAKSIPLWNRTLSSIQGSGKQRIEMDITGYSFPHGEKLPADDNDDAGESGYDRRVREINWLRSTRVLVQPEPGEYQSADQPASVDLREQFRESGLQVIVKLANVGKYS